MKYTILFLMSALLVIQACAPKNQPSEDAGATGLKVAYVNGDSIVYNYSQFRQASENIDRKQRDAEARLQAKMKDLEGEIMAYQRKAQAGSLSPKEMQAQEQRLGGMQEALRAESDEVSQSLMAEMTEINDRLQKVVKDKLQEIRDAEGYDFIFNYADGGAILIAGERFDITDRVLRELNDSAVKIDTAK